LQPSCATHGSPVVWLQAWQVQSPIPHLGLVQLVELLHQAQVQFERQ
jgi:hypothetical protein